MNYWLLKTEPDEFSIDDLKSKTVAMWDGIRNYQARNFIRDQVSVDDLVFIYHSSCKVPAIVGIGKVVKSAYPDPNQFNPESRYFDAKANPDAPRWFCFDVAFVQKLRPIALTEIKKDQALSDMYLVSKGARLSVQPVTKQEWEYLIKKSTC